MGTNKLFATVAISLGQKLKKLYDEVYAEDQSKTPEEVLAILEKLKAFCEQLNEQYADSNQYLNILLDSAGEDASLYFNSHYLKHAQQTSKSKKTKRLLVELNQKNKKHSSRTYLYAQRLFEPASKDQTLKNKIVEDSQQDQRIGKHISEHHLFTKYNDAKKGSAEYVKNDFMNHLDPSKHYSLDEVVLERAKALHMSPAQYKEDLINVAGGSSSKMEALVNLIEPGWSKLPAPTEDSSTILKSGS